MLALGVGQCDQLRARFAFFAWLGYRWPAGRFDLVYSRS